MSERVDLTVIVPVLAPCEDFGGLNDDYLAELCALPEPCEIIYVLDYRDAAIDACVAEALERCHFAKAISLNRRFGDSTALNVGIQAARGARILVLPAYRQVEPRSISAVLHSLETCDLAIGARDRSSESILNRVHGWLFNGLLARLASSNVDDIGCEVMAFRREVCEEVNFHGGQHRFLPVLAERVGFQVRNVPVEQAPRNARRGFRPLSDYVRSGLDLLTIVILTRFIKKPLRFFGIPGLILVVMGIAITLHVVLDRFIYDIPLTTRPVFVLGTLMLVAGIQVIGIGLVGEIVIFSRAKDLPSYHIKEIVQSNADGSLIAPQEAQQIT